LHLADKLAAYAHGLAFDDLDSLTVAEAKKRIVDALGCAIGAYEQAPIRMARKTVLGLATDGSSTLWGAASRTTPDMATFVNGFMIRYFDYNDTYLSKEPAHPSDNLAPCLSVAESEGSNGRELITALALSYEIQCRLCDAADIRHRGWDHVCYGLVSSALAAGKLMGLDRHALAQAVNIALSSHIALRQVRAGELSMWKGASFANAARNAVFSAMLAREGMEGPSPVFEGEMGFFKQVSGPFSLDVSRFGGRRGRFKLPETYIKLYPAEYHAQSAIAAALEARRAIPDTSKVESVLVETHEAGYSILGKDPEKWKPGTKETADHSLPFVVGTALLEGRIDNSSYSPSHLGDRQTLDLLRRISVKEDRRLSALYPSEGIGNRVTVRLSSGQSVSSEVLVPKGHPKNPMSSEELVGKFRRLTSGLLTGRGSDQALEILRRLEDQRDLSRLTKSLRVS
jgi:2-methylcitrate dehydratase